jgi:hypothetical protein
MKTGRLILTIVALLACSILLIAPKPMPIEAVEEISDTWANAEYDTIDNKYAKITFKANKTWYTYEMKNSQEPTESGTYTIAEGWEVKECIYYKVIRVTEDELFQYELYRFSNFYRYNYGTVLEIVSSAVDFPTEINPNDSTYSILYLQRGKQIARSAFVLTVVVVVLVLIF